VQEEPRCPNPLYLFSVAARAPLLSRRRILLGCREKNDSILHVVHLAVALILRWKLHSSPKLLPLAFLNNTAAGTIVFPRLVGIIDVFPLIAFLAKITIVTCGAASVCLI
jgi:hypothetical protein